MTHTPGPWHCDWGFILAGDATGNQNELYIARIDEDHFTGAPMEQWPANARLIAAAPELLDMCERLLGFAVHHGAPSAVEAGHGMLEAARELLAKAKGTEQ